jgi:type 1 fimbria pilin
MEKKSCLIGAVLFLVIVASVFVSAQNKIEISTIKESFQPGENITFKVSLYDANNNPINADISVTIEDAKKISTIEKVVASNIFGDVSLGENARNGLWKITAKYGTDEATGLFMISTKEQVKFELNDDILTITNTGNTRYAKDVQIAIGDTIGVRSLDLDVGEQKSFRLIAPDGVYNVRVTDGTNIFIKNEVGLTGKAVGVLDKDIETDNTGITGVLNPNEDTATNKTRGVFIYVFLIMVVGAAVLLAIERVYRKKIARS